VRTTASSATAVFFCSLDLGQHDAFGVTVRNTRGFIFFISYRRKAQSCSSGTSLHCPNNRNIVPPLMFFWQ